MAFWNRNKILSDKELAEGIVRGDEVCYERFFERYYVVVRKFIMSFIGDRAAAEDLAQELFIRLWNIFRVWLFDRCTADSAKQLIQPGDRSHVATSAKLDPEYYQTIVWVPSAHILYQRDLSLCVLLWMAVRTVGAVCQ